MRRNRKGAKKCRKGMPQRKSRTPREMNRSSRSAANITILFLFPFLLVFFAAPLHPKGYSGLRQGIRAFAVGGI
jgi:hypothetical protein